METGIRIFAEPNFRALTSDGFRRLDQNLNSKGALPSAPFLVGGKCNPFQVTRVSDAKRCFCGSKHDEAHRVVPFMFRVVNSTNDAADVCGVWRAARGAASVRRERRRAGHSGPGKGVRGGESDHAGPTCGDGSSGASGRRVVGEGTGLNGDFRV